MRVAVIGAGNIGGTLGGNWEKAGHDVVYGLRDPAKRKGAETTEQAIEGADVVLLALPGDAAAEFIARHSKGLNGKVVIDATNNFRGAAMNCWEEVAPLIPDASLYRAFNSYGVDIFVKPDLGGEQADLFYAGPEGAGKAVVEQLISDAGLRPVWVGGSDQAGVVDGVLRLWFTLSQKRGRRIAFKLLSD
jgi:predicted dinucleotide-binding enzyme